MATRNFKTKCRRRKINTFSKIYSLINKEGVHNFIHPAFKRIAKCYFNTHRYFQNCQPNKQRKTRRPSIFQLSLKIEKKLFYSTQIPRCPIFYCPKCALFSRHLSKLMQHICSRKIPDYPNVERIVQLGFRSRVKDSLAVMERATKPQSIDLLAPPSGQADTISRFFFAPPTLSEIAYKAVNKHHLHYDTLVENELAYPMTSGSTNIDYCRASPSDQSKGAMPDGEHPLPTNPVQSEDGLGYLCRNCEHLFARFMDFDSHLENNSGCSSSTSDPVEIQISSEMHFIPRGILATCNQQTRETIMNRNSLACTKCGDNKFADRNLFHKHLVSCAFS